MAYELQPPDSGWFKSRQLYMWMYRVYRKILQLDTGAVVETAIVTVSSNVTLDTLYHTILADATAGAFNITLPSAALFERSVYNIKKIDATTNAVTIVGTVDGDTNFDLELQDEIVTIQSDGSGWWIAG